MCRAKVAVDGSTSAPGVRTAGSCRAEEGTVLCVDRLSILFEGCPGIVRFRVDTDRLGADARNLRFSFESQLNGYKVPPIHPRGRKGTFQEFSVTFPDQKAGAFVWYVTAEYESGGSVRTFEGEVQLVVMRPGEARQVAVNIMTTITAGHATDVNLNQNAAQALEKILQSKEDPFEALRRLIQSNERVWVGVELFEADKPSTPPPASEHPSCTEEDAARTRVEAMIAKRRLERIPDADGVAERKKALSDLFDKVEMCFEARLLTDTFHTFAAYVKQLEELEKLDKERKARLAAERERQRIARKEAKHKARLAEEAAERERKRIAREEAKRKAQLAAGAVKTVTLPGGAEMRFRWCPAGTFEMGSPESEEGRYDDERQHRVTLTKGFWMAETEVTQGQWRKLMDGETVVDLARKGLQDDTEFMIAGKKQTLREFWRMERNGDPRNRCGDLKDGVPVYNVSWNEAVEFCRRLTQRERAAERIPDGYEYRIPTEAEWEYACRAGTTTALPNGRGIRILGANNAPALDDIAWYGGNSSVGFVGSGWKTSNWPEKQYPDGTAGPRGVKRKAANAWGLYDMIGNVFEWCADWYGEYPSGSVTDPTGPSEGVYRVLRGGGWFGIARFCRSADRVRYEPGFRNNILGFRLALAPSH